jgi:hypothetical protein
MGLAEPSRLIMRTKKGTAMNFFCWIIKNIVFGVGLWTIAKWIFLKNRPESTPRNFYY